MYSSVTTGMIYNFISHYQDVKMLKGDHLARAIGNPLFRFSLYFNARGFFACGFALFFLDRTLLPLSPSNLPRPT
jgi:hypothetical protein